MAAAFISDANSHRPIVASWSTMWMANLRLLPTPESESRLISDVYLGHRSESVGTHATRRNRLNFM